MSATTAKLSLGPLLFHWQPERWRDFYFRIADEAPIESVYLGEVVCPKRISSFEAFLPEVVDRLGSAGKEVVLSSLALAMTGRESRAITELAEAAGDMMIEVNDLFAATRLNGRPHVVGPFVNCYNEGTLGYLMGLGATRLVPPAEIPIEAIPVLAKLTEIEMQAFGRMPLALSARCYHARSRGLAKDACQYVCAEDPDGMDVYTMDDQPFLAVNGIQTMSFCHANLLCDLDSLTRMGVRRFRLWPHSCDMVGVAGLFRAVLDGTMEADRANERLAELLPEAVFANGYAHGLAGSAFAGEDRRPD